MQQPAVPSVCTDEGITSILDHLGLRISGGRCRRMYVTGCGKYGKSQPWMHSLANRRMREVHTCIGHSH